MTGLMSKRLMVFSLAVIACCLGLGCNNTSHQKSLLAGAMNQLAADYNRGGCAEIYSKADTSFKGNAPMSQWSDVCASLHDRLGTWKTAQTEQTNNWPVGPVGILWIESKVQFEKGAARVRSDWKLIGGDLRLYNLTVQESTRTIDIPGFGAQRTVN